MRALNEHRLASTTRAESSFAWIAVTWPWWEAAIGFIVFAAIMMIMVGVFQALQGLVGIFENEFYVATRNYLFQFDATTWGWIHLLLGLLVAFAGCGLLSGQTWARRWRSSWPCSARSPTSRSSPTTRSGSCVLALVRRLSEERARRVQGRGDVTVVKLRPIVPGEAGQAAVGFA